jgi:hypothetical protein
MKVHAATSLTAPQAALALAIALERTPRGEARSSDEAGRVAAQLDSVARGLFAGALETARANRELVRRIDDAPGPLERGDFRIAEPGSGFGSKVLRVLGFGRSREVDSIDELERQLAADGARPAMRGASAKVDPKRRAQLAELSALAEDALRTSGNATRRS